MTARPGSWDGHTQGMWRVGTTKLIQPWGAETARGQLRKMGVSAAAEAASALLLQGTERGVLEVGVSRKDILEEIW